jgi:rhamnulokinase
MNYYLAIDIGASSGRHIIGYMENGELKTEELYRFYNGMDKVDGHLVWDTDRLFSEIKEGIKKSFQRCGKIKSLSIDTWGVDYVLFCDEREVKPAYAYRDARMDEVIDLVHAIVPHSEMYKRTGIEFQKFNTVYQLYADKVAGRLEGVTDFLMLPEYFMYRLTGVKKKEFCEGTTTSLVNVNTRAFDEYLFDALGFPKAMIKPLSLPGTLVGNLRPELVRELGGDTEVVFCPTHDTASAVEAIEMKDNAPYISSGTWSLLGVKTLDAITDENSRLAGYSNEGGVGYYRYQKNITGMWLVQSLRGELCPETSYTDIVKMAEASSYTATFDVNDPAFSAPESMCEAIKAYLVRRGFDAPVTPGDYFNAAYLSLADGYKRAIVDMETNTGKSYDYIYIVGGGAKNAYLNALTEKATGKKVVALPIEATAIGNLKTQIKRAEG